MIRLFFVIVCLLLISGCGFKDIDKRFFVLAIGLDASDDEQRPYRVSLKLGIPSSKIEPGRTDRYQVVTQDAATITEAVRLLKSKVDKELDFGHAKVFVFGKKLAGSDMQKSLDWFTRRRDIQSVGFTAIGDPTAIEVLKTSPASERLPANALFLSFDHEGTESAYIITETLSDLYRRMTERGKDPYLPIIRAKAGNFEINQVAILDKKKVKMILNTDETRLLNQMMRGFSKMEIKANVSGKTFLINVGELKRKFQFVSIEPPVVRMTLTITGIVEESTEPIFNDDWKKLQQEAEQDMQHRYTQLLDKLRKNRLDPIGFGLRYRAIGHVSEGDWSNWMDLYARIKFETKLNLKLTGSGVIK